MNDIRRILDDAYQLAESHDIFQFELSHIQRKWIVTITEKAESHKAVLAALITSLVKKIETPTQDIRYHKKELSNGYSGRGFDTLHVTPFIAEKFPRFAMKGGSGWLTRSLEQAHPFTLDFPGRIRNLSVKDAFLQILNDIEENQANPKNYLHGIFTALIDLMERSKINLDLFESENRTFNKTQHTITIDSIVDLLKRHFSIGYGVSGASRLPVLAVYSAYQMLMAIDRYKGKTLSPLKSHTTSDIKSGGIGDIEILDENGDFFEAIEIKHNIPISQEITHAAYDKFAQTPVSRYYLLTTAEPNVEDIDSVNRLINKINTKHGCEVIVNGIIPSLKYYLRLLSNPKLFLDHYSKNLELDFNQNTDIKEIHLRYWKDLLKYLSGNTPE
ncbi:DNA methyltransferase [Candidatus Poribacteria bacterium]|nr:DNA methyltransferase [Candidatus Poribacteria bacterium]